MTDVSPPDSRTRMIASAAELFREQGYSATGFRDVVEHSGAPRGSIYHHFPGGKDELVAAAIARVSERTLARLTELGGSATSLTEGFLGLWRALLDRSGLTAGCAVVAVSVAASDDLLDRAGTVFREWTAHLAALLEEAGVAPARAASFAVLLISATEGAVVMARAQRDLAPFESVAATLMASARDLDADAAS